MRALVLVHGAWQGAWCWERALPLFREAGHQAIAPTLTGSGERAAEMTPAVTLDTHVDDIARVIVEAGLEEVVLVGHSYSGMVITGVAETITDRIALLVFVDAFYPEDGESALDQMAPRFQETFRRRAVEEGEGWRLPAYDGLLDVWGLSDEADRAWVRDRLTDWSLNCFSSPIRAPEMRRSRLPRLYLSGAAEQYPGRAVFGPMADRARADGCEAVPLDAGHDLMIEAPGEFAEAVLGRV